MSWLPHTTVATIVELDGKLLMVEETDGDHTVFNQPAGHVEEDETLFEAALRETLEESAWQVELEFYLGTYIFRAPANGVTYIRHCFIAKPLKHFAGQALDDGIIAAHWISPADILQESFAARSPLVRRVVRDYLSGRRYPLDIIYHHMIN